MILTEVIQISDSVSAVCCRPTEIIYFLILLIVSIVLTVIIKYNKFHKEYFAKSFNDSKQSPILKTPYDDFDEASISRIVDKLSRNYGILITIYGLLFTFIISQNFQHVFSKWTIIIWSGWVLAIIIKNANIALDLTDIVEIAKKNNNIGIATTKIYAYNRYFKHASYFFVLAVAFSPIVFIPINVEHDNDFKLWDPQLSIVIISIGIISVAWCGYYFSQVEDFLRPGVPLMYFFALTIVVSQSLSNIGAAPLIHMPVSLLGLRFDMPQLLWVFLWVIMSYAMLVGGIFVRSYLILLKERRKKSMN